MPICIECLHIDNENNGECGNPELPLSDFVYGTRNCYELNSEGDCKGFTPQDKPESIYELKKDEGI